MQVALPPVVRSRGLH
jgi:hypothetical protein